MSRLDAEQALRDIDVATKRARAFSAYAAAGPVIAVWGLVWLVTNLTKAAHLPQAAAIGAAAMVVGILASIVSGVATRRAPRAGPKAMLAGAAFAGLMVSVVAVVGPLDIQAATAAIGLIVAAAYIFAGLMAGSRIAWLGLAVATVVLVAWFGLRAQFDLVLGLAGGAVLTGTGLWLWRQ